MGVCSTPDCNESSNVQDSKVQEQSPTISTASNLDTSSDPVSISTSTAERAQIKGLLAEARNTREMLVNFEAAVTKGTFLGNQMLDLAKGLAFLDAILKQNSAHIANLQERLNG